jgi:hypothetical protein
MTIITIKIKRATGQQKLIRSRKKNLIKYLNLYTKKVAIIFLHLYFYGKLIWSFTGNGEYILFFYMALKC